ncbi:MAG TPA: dihydroorotate dehydrogenase electron transfer subunit [Vicinamibacterales bacterium]|jgi:dihydroorotate dehydrogenase electron transfer subunit|nr:dihydroorotate dehydrogenase electron transfer subunit [Vicinamibacterales bacterium]
MPSGIFDVRARVIANRRLSSDYNVLALAAPTIAARAAPGQFVMLKAGSTYDPLLRRPFSIFEILRDRHGTPSGLSVLSKRIGASTRLFYDAEPGQTVATLGPLGRPFMVVDRPTEAWMVAGGVGLAPFATLAETLRSHGVGCTLFYGARRATELFHLDFFRALGVDLVLSTEDGSFGERGHVVAPLERALLSRSPASRLMVYACGPERMLAATARATAKHERPCQVSVERIMGCGLGGCYSCVVPMRHDHGVHHVRSCLTGPVLQADQIVWD